MNRLTEILHREQIARVEAEARAMETLSDELVLLDLDLGTFLLESDDGN